MTIEEYLRGKVGFEVADNAISVILEDRDIAPGEDSYILSTRTKELATADLYMWCASTPSKQDTSFEADGGWKSQKGGWQSSAFDKRNLRDMANAIYAKYDEMVHESNGFTTHKL
jgi:hypothetical protein